MIEDYDLALEHLYLLRSWGLDVNDMLAKTLLASGQQSQALSLYRQMIDSDVYSEELRNQYRQIVKNMTPSPD
jgi:hypothetical protein